MRGERVGRVAKVRQRWRIFATIDAAPASMGPFFTHEAAFMELAPILHGCMETGTREAGAGASLSRSASRRFGGPARTIEGSSASRLEVGGDCRSLAQTLSSLRSEHPPLSALNASFGAERGSALSGEARRVGVYLVTRHRFRGERLRQRPDQLAWSGRFFFARPLTGPGQSRIEESAGRSARRRRPRRDPPGRSRGAAGTPVPKRRAGRADRWGRSRDRRPRRPA